MLNVSSYMSKEQYIVGLDIGTQTIRVVQGKVSADGSLQVIGVGSSPASGMRKGVIVDIEEAVSAISSALEKVERMTGVPVTNANISVGGSHVTCMESKGVIAISRADGEIAENDIIRVIDASQAISIPPNREVVHVVPRTFTLDGQAGIKDPLGMTGIRLEVETLIIHTSLPFIKNLNKAVIQTGLEVDQLVVSPLASAQSVLTRRQKELGVLLVDMGAGTTSIAVYEEDNLLHTAVIPVGGMHITNDIAIGLRCTVDTAEKVKVNCGQANPKNVDKIHEIDLSKFDPEETGRASKQYIAEIIEARLEEIFDFIARDLKRINRDGKLPAGIIITGGGSKIPGLVDFAKTYLRLPAQIGTPTNVQTVIDQIADPQFATVVGLVLWGSRYSGSVGGGSLMGVFGTLFENQSVLKLKKWFKSFLP
jgi:cell division protein FtsA